jgi:uncharacterized protein (TIGR03067 family)
MPCRTLLCLAAALLSLAFAPAPFPRAKRPKDDLTRMQGNWVLISAMSGGTPQTSKLQAIIARDHLFLVDPAGKYRWNITIDPRASPKALDMRLPAGNSSTLLRTAYSLEGDTLKICYQPGQWAVRPTSVSGTVPSHYLWVFKRAPR